MRRAYFFFYCLLAAAPAAVFLIAGPPPSLELIEKPATKEYAASLIEQKADPNDPDIRAWAAAIEVATKDPKQRAGLAFTTMLLHVQYALDEQAWLTAGQVRTIAEMRARAVQEGWPLWRGDCKGQAIVLYSLLRAMGMDAAVQARLWRKPGDQGGHVWTSVTIGGTRYAMNATADAPGLRLAPLTPDITSASPEQLRACRRLGLLDGDRIVKVLPELLDRPNWHVRFGWALLSLPLTIGMLLVSSDFQRWVRKRRCPEASPTRLPHT